MGDQKINVSTLGRVKANIWLLILSLFTVIAMFTSIYYYDENIKSKQRFNDVTAELQLAERNLNKTIGELTSAKNELTGTNAKLASTKEELDRMKDALNQAGKKKIQSMDKLAHASYDLRNRIEDVEKRLDKTPERKELNRIRAELTINLETIRKGLGDILNILTEKEAPSASLNFNFFSLAYAQEIGTNEGSLNKVVLLILGAVIITIILIVMCAVLLISEDKEKVKFAQSTIQTIIAFAVGVMGGKIA